MKKYKNLHAYLEAQGTSLTREDLKDFILRTSLDLLSHCSKNFEEDPKKTEQAATPLYFFNEILDQVE